MINNSLFYQLDAQILYFLNTFITFLSMFRALLCSSSGGQIVLVQPLVSSLSLGDCSVHRLREDCRAVISPSQRPLPDNTQHSQQTDIHGPGGIRTHNPSRRAAADRAAAGTGTYPTSYVMLTARCSRVVSPTFFLGGTLNIIFDIPRKPYQ